MTGKLLLTALVTATALLLAACGGSEVSDDPQAALAEAVEALGAYDGVELRLSIDADDTARQSLLTDDVDPGELDLVLGGTLTARVVDEAAELTLALDGQEVAGLRVLSESELFVLIDLPRLETAVDDPALRDEADELVAAAAFFGLGEVVQAARDGRWIRISGLQELTDLADAFDGAPADEELDESEAEDLARELTAALERFLDDEVTITYLEADEVGERIRVSASQEALERLLTDAGRAASTLGPLDALGADDLATDAFGELRPGQVLAADVWLSGGEIVQLGFDLPALSGEPLDGELFLLVGISEDDEPVTAPGDAVDLDLFSVIGGFFGGMGGPVDPFDAFGDDFFAEDPFGDDGPFGGDDPFGDDPFGDDDPFDDAPGGEDCITQEELDEIAQFLGEDALEEFQELIDAGFLELC